MNRSSTTNMRDWHERPPVVDQPQGWEEGLGGGGILSLKSLLADPS